MNYILTSILNVSKDSNMLGVQIFLNFYDWAVVDQSAERWF